MSHPQKVSFFKRIAGTFQHREGHHDEHHDDEGEDEQDPQLHRRTSAAANALDLAHPSQQGKLAHPPPTRAQAAADDAPPPYSAEDAGTARSAGWPQGQSQHFGQAQYPQQQQQQQQQNYYGRPYNPAGPPPARLTSAAQNTGAQLGMFDAMATGGNVGAGIVDGAIVGNVVGQRVDQARNHEYWRQRQAAYLAGDESAVVNTGVPMTAREARREERRRRRWERRRSWGN
jgi:hypothetical protein